MGLPGPFGFGSGSEAQLATCEPALQLVLREAIKYVNFAVVEGHRGEAAQNQAFAEGKSKLQWPNGNHNATPSKAADLAPFPVDWGDTERAHLRFAFLMGVVRVCASQLGVKVRFGMDWNRNLDPRDESFLDYGHVELDYTGL